MYYYIRKGNVFSELIELLQKVLHRIANLWCALSINIRDHAIPQVQFRASFCGIQIKKLEIKQLVTKLNDTDNKSKVLTAQYTTMSGCFKK